MPFSPPDAADVWQHKNNPQVNPVRDAANPRIKKRPAPLKLYKPKSSASVTVLPKASLVEAEKLEAAPTPPPKSERRAYFRTSPAAEPSPRRSKMSSSEPLGAEPTGPKVKRNVWASWVKDDGDRSHITPMSTKEFAIRAAQIILATIFLVLTSFSAFNLSMGNFSGFGLSFFVFSLTVTYFVLYGVVVLKYPFMYHWTVPIVFEVSLFIFWLAAWATLASYATVLNVAQLNQPSGAIGLGPSAAVVPAAAVGIAAVGGPAKPPGPPGPAAVMRALIARLPPGLVQAATATTPASIIASSSGSDTVTAEILIAVAAGLGAIVWVLFGITMLQAIALRVAKHRKGTTYASVDKGKGKEPAEVTA